nr:M4 family metallopeptidase [Peribacillus kribbensis]
MKHMPDFVVPVYILERLAQNDVDAARASLSKLRLIHRQRNLLDFDLISTAIGEGGSERHVYDCGHNTRLRVQEARKEGDRSGSDEAVNQAYDFAGIVRDYFKEVLNRNSIDNRGLDLLLNVHYGRNFLNAFWNGEEMVFGDGDGKIFIGFTSSLDVIGHELTHGVTQYTSGLEYEGQSGAINEHLSDVFGTVIKQHHLKQTASEADWLIGADIMGPSLKGQALRSMKAPGTAFDNKLMGKDMQPDHMKNYYSGSDDNYGVHINSGILNKAFYLVSMEIGTDKAAAVWYQGMQKLYATADFSAFFHTIQQAAQSLADKGEVPETAPKSVESAFQAVGISQ